MWSGQEHQAQASKERRSADQLVCTVWWCVVAYRSRCVVSPTNPIDWCASQQKKNNSHPVGHRMSEHVSLDEVEEEGEGRRDGATDWGAKRELSGDRLMINKQSMREDLICILLLAEHSTQFSSERVGLSGSGSLCALVWAVVNSDGKRARHCVGWHGDCRLPVVQIRILCCK